MFLFVVLLYDLTVDDAIFETLCFFGRNPVYGESLQRAPALTKPTTYVTESISELLTSV